MLEFKNTYCPDPKEQLGFSKGAQTNYHILTLKTLVDKYTKKKKVKLYACFVDLRKAFDTVCRDLLLHKIACLGITGNFFNCLSDMYKNSIARIKISKLLSPDINIGNARQIKRTLHARPFRCLPLVAGPRAARAKSTLACE